MAFDFAAFNREITLSADLMLLQDERGFSLKPPRDGEKHDVVLYLGCNVLRTSHMIQLIRLLVSPRNLLSGFPWRC